MPDKNEKPVFAFEQLEIDLARRELRSGGQKVPLGSRAFHIIEVLIQSAGDLVTKTDLMKSVWSGVSVEENTLHAHISAVRKAFGPEGDRLLKTISGQGYRLIGNWAVKEQGEVAAPPVEPPSVLQAIPTTNLPAATRPLLGRTEELSRLQNYLSAYRAVTLTGPGGIGKTALALEVARTELHRFEGDIRFVELASLSDPQLVPSTIATAVGLKIGGDEISSSVLARAIGNRKILIVLDNCEHVVDSAAEATEAIVHTCPHATLLSTSREVLRVDGEYVYRVPPLELPLSSERDSEVLLRHGAVQLFINRTKALQADFTPDNDNLATITSICRDLDGVPLAIEFAAARVATLGLQQVASRLNDRFALLKTGRRTALDRHQTMRATMDWSYRLLSEHEQRLLRRLSIFAGGFTIEAAAAVMADVKDATTTTLDGIANLVSKSLVTLDESGSRERWRLLETIRIYALEKLAESGEAEQIARRHAGFFRDFSANAAIGSRIKPGNQDTAPYSRELDNVRSALDWCFSSSGDLGVGIQLTAAYAPVWLHSALLLECRDRCERALSAVGGGVVPGDQVLMDLNVSLGFALVFTMGDKGRTGEVLAAAFKLAQRLNNDDAELRGLGALIAMQFINGESGSARTTAERFLAVASKANDAAAMQIGERLLGNALLFAGELPKAQIHLGHVLEISGKLHDQLGTLLFRYDQHALARGMLARVLWLRGFPDQAIRQARDGLTEAQSGGDQLTLCWVLFYGVFPVALMTDDFATAERAVATLTDPVKGLPSGIWRIVARFLQGKLMIARGSYGQGVDLLRSAIDACDKSGWRMSYPEFLSVLGRGLAELGRPSEAMAAIERGLVSAGEGREQWYVPELLRTKGELLLKQAGDQSGAEACFQQALDVAGAQSALAWQLRAALSFARLKVEQRRPAEARQILAPVFGRFTEGFETPDLQAAKVMLASLALVG